MKVNGNVLFLVAAVFGLATISGIVVLDVTGNDTDAQLFITSVGTIMTSLLGFGALLVKSNSVEMKVNGNLSKALDAALLNPNSDNAIVAQVSAETGVAPTTTTIPTIPAYPTGPVTNSTEGH